MRLGDTGTSGLGGPTSFSVTINRATVPSIPSIVTLSSVTNTSVMASFTDGASNGAAIDARQIGYGTSPTNVQNTISSDGSTAITGLTPGVTYYFWARTHNSVGWSGYGTRGTATTYQVPEAPDSPILSNATQTSFVVSFTDNGTGGSPIVEREIVYTIDDPDVGNTHVNYTGVMTVSGLLPGTEYIVWSRVRNAAGLSPYSAESRITTIAGAFVLVGVTYKKAIPYVRDGGVWKLARPWGRIAGIWKETT